MDFCDRIETAQNDHIHMQIQEHVTLFAHHIFNHNPSLFEVVFVVVALRSKTLHFIGCVMQNSFEESFDLAIVLDKGLH